MHEIEPYYNWRDNYIAADDPESTFFNREYSEFSFTNSIYDHLIHPQWDEFGSNTLFIKILMVNYESQYCIIEMLGEWNDLLYNDIMFLYRNVIEILLENEIKYFILIGENILNFHADSNDYYEEWFNNIDDGWIVGVNFRDFIIKEFEDANIDYFIAFSGEFNEIAWRNQTPDQLFEQTNSIITKRIGI
ncbi:MAG: hypothetical protein HQ521_08630 [Bacteroidetes bacterium]|nr:hypothetical protein [Bacteroidota bacterium]